MAWRKINDSILTDIANAIRAKAGTGNAYKPQEMAKAIETLPEGGEMPTMSVLGFSQQDGTPTPENPVPIQCAKAGIGVWVYGKNLADFGQYAFFDLQPDGSYKSNTTIRTTNTLPVSGLAPGIYTLSAWVASPAGKNYRMNIKYTDGTQQSASAVTSTGDYVFSSVTSDPAKTISELGFTYAGNSNDVRVKNFQLEKGNTATAFEPYVGAMTTATAWINTSSQLSFSSDSFAARLEVKPNTQYELYLDATASTLFRAGATSSSAIPVTGAPILLSPCVRDNAPNHIILNTNASAKYIWVQIAAGQRKAIYSLTVKNKSNGKTYKPFMASKATLLCDLHEGDTWYPTMGRVVRRKECVVLTGTEAWTRNASVQASCAYTAVASFPNYKRANGMCSHFPVTSTVGTSAPAIFFDAAINLLTDFATATELKAWLAEQYAAGTPVCVMYELTTPMEELYSPNDTPLLTGAPMMLGMMGMSMPVAEDDEGGSEVDGQE